MNRWMMMGDWAPMPMNVRRHEPWDGGPCTSVDPDKVPMFDIDMFNRQAKIADEIMCKLHVPTVVEHVEKILGRSLQPWMRDILDDLGR
jgi:hypothetical protein